MVSKEKQKITENNKKGEYWRRCKKSTSQAAFWI